MKAIGIIRYAATTLLLIMVAQGAWALSGGGTLSDPYRIASASDWNELATNVNNGTTYSGMYLCLTADISVTNTMVGNSEEHSFRGTFDGRGHTLTISYNTSSDITAPFRYIQGATFKNLKVTGSITTTKNLAAGIAGLNTNAVATFEQCATDVTINSSSTTVVGWGRVDYHGGLLARTNSKDVNITDCFCGGSVNGSNSASSISYCASFVGVAVGCTVSATRCLCTTSYTNVTIWNPLCHAADAVRSTSVFYYVNGNDVCDGATQVTTSQVADGSLITALQAGRSTTVWVQNATTHQPMQNIFAFNKAVDGYYLIGSEQDWRLFSSVIQSIPTANARMTEDIGVTTMVGTGSGEIATLPFCGTFDGDGHTLTFTISTSEDFVAPFRYINGATIKNLIVDGSNTSSARYNAGMVAVSDGTTTISNCVVSATVTNNVGSTPHGDGNSACGGILGLVHTGNFTFNGCLFSGKILGTANCFGGFVGWGNDTPTVVFNNCLFDPAELANNTYGTKTFYRGGDTYLTVNNSYYRTAFGDPQGTAATPTSNQPSNLGTLTAAYSVSGITAYNNGLYQNSLYFCGSPNFTLSVASAIILGESKYVTTFYHGTLDYQLPAGALAYTAGKDGDKVVFYRIGPNSNVIPADTAAIIVADTEGPITLTKLSSTDVTAKAGNILRGSDTDIAKPAGTVYVLSVVESTPGFYPFTGSTLPAGKAYYVK